MSCQPRAGAPRLRPVLSLTVTTVLLMVGLIVADTPLSHASPEPLPLPRQWVTIAMLPPIAQPGPSAATPVGARSVVTARFHPAVQGRSAVLQAWRHHRWERVGAGRLDGRGRVTFTPRTRIEGRPVTYRVRALPHRGLAAVRSHPVRSNAWARPAFAEEFEGDALGSEWEHRIQFYNRWGGRSCSKGDPSAVAVGGGALRLSVLADPAPASESCQPQDATGDPVGADSYAWRLNGHVSTQGSFDFQYGVAAARMRFQRPRGQHASFWMQPRGLLEDRPTPWGAEIDVIEWFGSDGGRQRMATSVHRRTDGGRQLTTYGGPIARPDRFLSGRTDRWWNAYHVFSVEWTPSAYVFRIDGQETMRTSQGVSHHPEFLILSMLSSDYELDDLDPDAGLPQHAYVDWVQVWQQP